MTSAIGDIAGRSLLRTHWSCRLDREMIAITQMNHSDLDDLFRELLATNQGPGYGISVIGATPDLSVIDVELRFLSGRSYCCAEPGCHVPRDNRRLLELAKLRSLAIPESVNVRWHCRVEEGAILEVLKNFGLAGESNACDKGIDPVAFALEKLRGDLIWIDEHRASFDALRASNPAGAEEELRYLRDCTDAALQGLSRLINLILSGHGIDPAKRLPAGLKQWAASRSANDE